MNHPEHQIHLLAHDELEDFFTYLNDHLADNGSADTPLFQPLARNDSWIPDEMVASFRAGMLVPVGEPGWRRVWVALAADGAIVGHIDLRAHPKRYANHRALLGMGVHRDCRKGGLGRRLIGAAIEATLANSAIEWIDLEVLSSNRPARQLYASVGFSVIGEYSDMYRIDGQSCGNVLMTTRIRS